jgi:hypothetical protein
MKIKGAVVFLIASLVARSVIASEEVLSKHARADIQPPSE